ncbi:MULTISPECIES: transcription initiation factor IIB [Halorussus]|uniref:transcription initiation factor IIB n=1 Tax=Halorussus TaxID=1070314 RepID=UPI0020A02579|nr:transcription initiation factor IIB family protein [Halorussus vallis]USZ78741.1 transcription initiation factor IIB family protein [Halorussus vallis]
MARQITVEHPREAHSGTCPECVGTLRTTGHETTCDDCGLIVDDAKIDHGRDWQYHETDDENPSRTGAPRTVSRHDKGLSTELYGTYDSHGTLLSARKRRQLRRLRKHHARSRFESKAERNQCYVFNEIRRITSALGLASTVRDRACDLFRSAQGERLTRGRTLEGFATACVYATCRCLGLPWQLSDFETLSRCGPEQTKNAYGVMNAELSLPVQPVAPRAYVPRYAAELGVSDETRRRARALVEHAEQNGLVGGQRSAPIAAAALYTAARESPDAFAQGDAARVAECSRATIRKRFQEFVQVAGHL